MMAAPEKPDEELTPDQVVAELQAAGIALTLGNLNDMLAAYRAEHERSERQSAVELFPLKATLPLHVSYEVGRRAAASGELRAQKFGGDWFVTKADVAAWLAVHPKRWFESEGALQKWVANLAQLKPRWIV
jgi:hypothetical protein